jgi:YD repeat-containing protein
MKERALFLLVLPLVCTGLTAQLKPVLNVPSPEVSNLGLYGSVPVSLSTGVPDISIPLHEVKVGNYTLPLSVSYHLAALKINSQAGCLGRGWSLVAGGYITRTIRGHYDEQQGNDGFSPGFYSHASKLKDLTFGSFKEHDSRFSPTDGPPQYELSADEFSFSFCGYTGNFYYNEDGGWTVVSDHDVKVEFNPSGDGFVNLDTIRKRLPTNGWGRAAYNNRFFNKFTLVTPDGTRYEFGGVDAMELSVPYYARHNCDLSPSTWHLARITTVEGRTVRLTYDTSGILCDLRYVRQQMNSNYNWLTSMELRNLGKAALTGFLIFPANLRTIETENEIVEFGYFPEANYASQFGDTQLAWTTVNERYGRIPFHSSLDSEDPANQFHLFLNLGSGDLVERIKATLRNNILYTIQVRPKRPDGKSRTLFLDYETDNWRRLSLITQWEGLQEPAPTYAVGGGVKVHTGYAIPELPPSIRENHAKRLPTYRLVYDTSEKIPRDISRMFLGTDSWGYYNGNGKEFDSSPEYSLKSGVFRKAQAEILREIIYPTGGRTRFEYESNDYSSVVGVDRVSLDRASGKAGGLRVRSVTNLDADNRFLGRKRYSYTTSRDGDVSSGVLKEMPTFSVLFEWKEDPGSSLGYSVEFKSEIGYYSSATNQNTPDVSYSRVFEETLDADGNSEGYVRHEFSSYATSPIYLDEPPIYSTALGDSYVKPYSSHATKRGKPLREDYFDGNGRLLRSVAYEYGMANPGSVATVDQKRFFLGTRKETLEVVSSPLSSVTRTYTYSYFPIRKTEREYAVSLGGVIEDGSPSDSPIGEDTPIVEGPFITPRYVKETEYAYNSHKLLSEETLTTSDGGTRVTDYRYPSDRADCAWMVREHIISPLVETRTVEGNSSTTVTATYGNRSGVPYIRRLDNAVDGVSRSTYTVNLADAYGNPVEIVEGERPDVLVWGYGGQRLLARVENATAEQVRTVTGVDPSAVSSQYEPSISWLTDHRHLLPLAQCHVYGYDDDLRLVSVTAPNGTMTFHEYDVLGRLVATYIQDNGVKSLRNIHDYRYLQPENQQLP